MRRELKIIVLFLAIFTVIAGVAYPLLVTGIAQVAFYHQANGSLIEQNGAITGSELIGQPFSDPKYFWPRPSATTPVPYNAASSGGSNLGPLNGDLHKQVAQRTAALKAADPTATAPAPVDLVTASASGLDPDITPAAAEYQVPRVAQARNLAEQQVRDLVARHTLYRTLGLWGERRVNVLLLNLALDELAAAPQTQSRPHD
jgi:potassium-transporting ATPase KdpC subunit